MQQITTLDVLAWICIQNEKLLCAKTEGNDVFYLPGGKRESGESDWEGISREVKEEMSVDLIQETLIEELVVKEEAHGFSEPTRVVMKCFRARYTGILKPSSEISEMAWLARSDIQQCAPATQRVIEHLASRQLLC